MNKKNDKLNSYLTVSLLGRTYKLNVNYINSSNVELNKRKNELDLFLPLKYRDSDKIDVINWAIKKLYDEVAPFEIENSMEIARHILKFAPEDYIIKRIKDEFWKCSKSVLVINPDIVQYSREVINSTIIMAFCKAKYRVNSKKYSSTLKMAMAEYERCSEKFKEKEILRVS